jgi:hypothetical protein
MDSMSAVVTTLRLLALVLLPACAGCATTYQYTFHLENRTARPGSRPGDRDVLDDADARAEILVDPVGERAVLLDLTNKTDQVLAVEWTKIVLTSADGSRTTPRPDVDLGWIRPGTTVRARLIPFALPPSGEPAARYQGWHFTLDVPVIVRRERKTYRYNLVATLQEMRKGEAGR